MFIDRLVKPHKPSVYLSEKQASVSNMGSIESSPETPGTITTLPYQGFKRALNRQPILPRDPSLSESARHFIFQFRSQYKLGATWAHAFFKLVILCYKSHHSMWMSRSIHSCEWTASFFKLAMFTYRSKNIKIWAHDPFSPPSENVAFRIAQEWVGFGYKTKEYSFINWRYPG